MTRQPLTHFRPAFCTSFCFGVATVIGLTAACAKTPTPEGAGAKASVVKTTGAPLATSQPTPSRPAASVKAGRGAIGQPAPAFSLPDLEGKAVSLSDFKGRTVVLEWFNPDCPFVKLAHTKGSLVETPQRHLKDGVVWLAINSAAPGKQGHGVKATLAGKERFALPYPILLDETGAVGRAYGAERTPHMFIIDPQGVLVYRGAIDNSPDAEQGSPTGGTLVNYVDDALAALLAGKPIANPETEAYGCSVKYGS